MDQTTTGNMFAIFTERCRKTPQAPLLILLDGTEISYSAALAQTGQIASALIGLGVKPGDRVAVQAEKSVFCLLLYLAVLRADAVYLPLNTAYTPGELRFFLGDAMPALFVCRPADRAVMGPLCAELGIARVACLDADGAGELADLAAAQSADAPFPSASGDDLAAILYTSGTTGRSKGAMLSHANLSSNALMLKDYWRFTEADRLLHALPIFHTHGLFVATNTVIAAGAAMIVLPKLDAAELVRLMPQASVLMGVPTFYTRLLAEPGFNRETAKDMRLFISGSAPLSAETHKDFAQRCGHAILERYGMTETNMNTSNPYDGERVAGTVGFPLPGVELRIADPESGRVLPQGEVGVIEVRGPNVFKGYWQLPEKTAEEFRPDGFFITGDLALIDPRGYVHIVGRAKDLIIAGGFNVYPAEVEAALDALPGVAESAVIGVPHPDLGEAVVAVIARCDSNLDETAVIAALAGELARFKQPRRVTFLDELPRNAMGKIQKNALREQFGGLFASTK